MNQKNRCPITTHVLDLTQGKGAAGIPVTLSKQVNQAWVTLSNGRVTNADGRIEDLLMPGEGLEIGTYKLVFDLKKYHPNGFYPAAEVAFLIRDPFAHHHVPLLLSPFGYSTYRGT